MDVKGDSDTQPLFRDENSDPEGDSRKRSTPEAASSEPNYGSSSGGPKGILRRLRPPKGRLGTALMLGASIALNFAAGTMFAQMSYLPFLKYQLGWDNQQTNLVFAFGMLGLGMSVIPGIMFDKAGPKIVCLYSAACAIISYFPQYAQVVTGFSSAGLFAFSSIFKGQSTIAMYQATIQTNVLSLPRKYSARVVGVLSAVFAVAGAIYGVIFSECFIEEGVSTSSSASMTTTSNVDDFLLMCGFIMLACGGLGALVLYYERNSPEPLLDLQAPLIKDDWKKPLKSLWTYPFWFSYILCLGTAQVFQGNIALLAESNGFSVDDAQLVVWISLFMNCAGRIAVGITDVTKRINRLVFMLGLAMIALICLILFSFNDLQNYMVWPGCLTLNFCLGGMMVIGAAYVSEQFAKKFYGLYLGTLATTCALLVLALSQVAGTIYDNHADESHHCSGTQCYRASFIMCACLSGAGVLLLFTLVIHTVNHKPPAPKQPTDNPL
ncbi:hypothetical protein Pelo_11548 [Pelomyxa schiedti]|nr:hypothetical protein Pelo_11548 [Pelomyxa schiedti]